MPFQELQEMQEVMDEFGEFCEDGWHDGCEYQSEDKRDVQNATNVD